MGGFTLGQPPMQAEYRQTDQLPSAADLYDRSIVLGGLSKSYGLPGLRSGWLTIPNTSAREAIINWKHYTSICPPAPSERLALAALKLGDALPRRSRAIIRKNLDAADRFFQKWEALFTWRPPQAGSIALVCIDVPSTTAYCHDLAKNAGILLLPGMFLGSDEGYVRFGFGRESFIEALSQYDNYLSRAI